MSSVGKGKAIPVQVWTDPEVTRSSRLPEFQAIAHEDGKVVSPTHRPPLLLQGIFLVLFLLEVESTSSL